MVNVIHKYEYAQPVFEVVLRETDHDKAKMNFSAK